MKLKDTGLTAQDIKDKVNKYMIETYERFDFLAETAKDMYLYDENKTVSEVAYELGFKYPHHLSRLFKKVFGMTPNEYRA